jgi:hypothetical protein
VLTKVENAVKVEPVGEFALGDQAASGGLRRYSAPYPIPDVRAGAIGMPMQADASKAAPAASSLSDSLKSLNDAIMREAG